MPLLAVVLLWFELFSVGGSPADGPCSTWWITGYVGSEYPGLTYDESTTTLAALARGERIAAASWDTPLGTYLDVEGLGIWRVADRGRLGPHHLDLLVATRAEAFALTGYRTGCIVSMTGGDDADVGEPLLGLRWLRPGLRGGGLRGPLAGRD